MGCAFTVLNALGSEFLEKARFLGKVYENALAFELDAAALSVAQQFGARVTAMAWWPATTSWTCWSRTCSRPS